MLIGAGRFSAKDLLATGKSSEPHRVRSCRSLRRLKPAFRRRYWMIILQGGALILKRISWCWSW
ncbi:hypothetical protein D3C85_1523040 [compost metagenome]